MNINTFTIKSQELLQNTMDYASSQSHQQVEPEHLMFLLLTTADSIISQCLKKIGTDPKMISSIIEKEVQNFPRVSHLQPNSQFLSKVLLQLLDKAYEQTLSMKDKYVGTEHLFLAFFDILSTATTILKNLGLDKDVFLKALVGIRGSKTITEPTSEEHYNSLERYAKDLNLMAKQNKLDPVIGRDDEIRRVLQILSRRTKNNPVLIGDPGVGKTAIVEGLAHKIISGVAPDNLATKRVFALDISSLVAGTKFRGEFEERMKSVIKEVTSSNGEIVLFIDEIHLLVGAGNASEGAMDAANILKPALARGEIHVIGATTLSEYKKYIEKDAALERRFQPIIVNEPNVEDTISILRGLKEKYEIHHGVRISDSALIAAAELSDRYIGDRFLPDKAIDVIDEVGSKFRLDIDSVPEEIDKLNREIRKLEIERAALLKELNSED